MDDTLNDTHISKTRFGFGRNSKRGDRSLSLVQKR